MSSASDLPLACRKNWAAIAALGDPVVRNFLFECEDSQLLRAFAERFPACFEGNSERVAFSRLIQEAKRLFKEQISRHENGLALDLACESLGIPILFSWTEDKGGPPVGLHEKLVPEWKPFNDEYICGAIIEWDGVRCMLVSWNGHCPAPGERWDQFKEPGSTCHAELVPCRCIDLNR